MEQRLAGRHFSFLSSRALDSNGHQSRWHTEFFKSMLSRRELTRSAGRRAGHGKAIGGLLLCSAVSHENTQELFEEATNVVIHHKTKKTKTLLVCTFVGPSSIHPTVLSNIRGTFAMLNKVNMYCETSTATNWYQFPHHLDCSHAQEPSFFFGLRKTISDDSDVL